MRENWTYMQYLRGMLLGLATSWGRIHWHISDAVEGLRAMLYMLALILAPLLIPFAPVLVFLVRASDKREAVQARKAKDERIKRTHQFGGK